MTSVPPAQVFRILIVCTGNICRSPLAAQLLVARLAAAGLANITAVESAGLGAMVGRPMDPLPAEISARYGANPSAHSARQLSSQIVGRSDLILTMTREQRNDVVKLFPRALHRTFSLNELTQLMSINNQPVHERVGPHSASIYSDDSAERLTLKTLAMSQIRSRAQVRPEDDIIDPYRCSATVHESVGQEISIACRHLVKNFVAWATSPAAVATTQW